VPSLPVAGGVLSCSRTTVFVAGYETASGDLIALQTAADGSRFALLPSAETVVSFASSDGTPARLGDVRTGIDYELCLGSSETFERSGRWIRFVETRPYIFVPRPPPAPMSAAEEGPAPSARVWRPSGSLGWVN
jgi:hypothetical protein